VFARKLGIAVEFVHNTRRRGLLIAPAKYLYQAVATVALLSRRRPRLILVQSPPSLAVLVVAIYGTVTGASYVVDAHSDAMLSPYWTRPRWLHRLLARRALATIVTNEHFAQRIRRWGAAALVLRDIPTSFPRGPIPPDLGSFNVLVVSTFASDEPLSEVLVAAGMLPEVTFHVTGDPSRADERLLADAPANVRFTGFLPDERYYALMRGSQAVMCLTTRDHTMQRGACEALSLGRPIITSDWPLLRDYFSQGTVHVGAAADDIRRGVLEMRGGHERYAREMIELQARQSQEWEAGLASLTALTTLRTSGDGGH
jgi:glycosyltransferase involved in cell wall biosynthesis